MTKTRKVTASDARIDVAIIGGGPAGISALLWASKLGLNALLIEKEADLGGQMHSIFNPIADYPGRATRSGAEMLRHFKTCVADLSDHILIGTVVRKIDVRRTEILSTSGNLFNARAIILAMGVRRRRLNIPGETEFAGMGILRSGSEQQSSVKGKRVAIVGGGDAAMENAIILSKVAKRVYLIHRRSYFAARPEFISRVRRDRRIELITDSVLTRIEGDGTLRSITIKDRTDDTVRELAIDALLIRIGVEPNTDLVRGQIELDDAGYVVVDAQCKTSKPNVSAVGDIANPHSPTLATSVGTGASAAQSVARSLLRSETPKS